MYWVFLVSLNFGIQGCARLLGEPLGLRGNELVWGSNPEPRASKEDALITPPCPPPGIENVNDKIFKPLKNTNSRSIENLEILSMTLK